MKNIITFLFILLGSLLTACGSEGFSSLPVSVMASSGNKVKLTGTWQSSCYQDGTDYFVDIRVYSNDGRLTTSTQKYTDSGCTSSAYVSTETFATEVNVYTGDDKSVGWSDSTPSGLSASHNATKYDYLQDDATIVKSIDLVDDSSSDWVLYRADSSSTGSDGYPDNLLSADPSPLSKQ